MDLIGTPKNKGYPSIQLFDNIWPTNNEKYNVSFLLRAINPCLEVLWFGTVTKVWTFSNLYFVQFW